MNASEYMAHWRTKKVWKRLEVPVHQARLKRCARLARGETFIDVGCALGHSTAHLAKFRPGAWAGMDFDQAAVEEARSRFPQFEFFYSPEYDMTAATGGRRFDSVICSEVIGHVPDDAGFVRGLIGLARRRVVLTTPNRYIEDPGHLRLYGERSLTRLLAGLKFRIERAGRFFYVVIVIGGKT